MLSHSILVKADTSDRDTRVDSAQITRTRRMFEATARWSRAAGVSESCQSISANLQSTSFLLKKVGQLRPHKIGQTIEDHEPLQILL